MRIAPLALAAVVLVGCGDESTSPPLAAPPDIFIVNGASGLGANAYDPPALTISLAAKASVKWRNNDPTVPNHTITSSTGAFDSGVVADGETYTFTFTAVGVYQYHCAVHPTMVGTVTVNP